MIPSKKKQFVAYPEKENKVYIAKYLPVKGGYSRIVKNNEGTPVDFEQEVKLFLCSRDIQIGDTAYNDKFYSYPDGQLIDTNSKVMDHGMMEIDSYKVIGEVSSEAIWVKEGDEFEESEIKKHLVFKITKDWKSYYKNKPRYGKNKITGKKQIVYPYSPTFGTSWEIIDPRPEDFIIKIKCDKCKTFH